MTTDDPKVIPGMAEAIEARRLDLGLTPGAFAEALGQSTQAARNLRNGLDRDYQDSTRFALARALRWPIDAIERIRSGRLPDAGASWSDVAEPMDQRVAALEAEVAELRAALSGRDPGASPSVSSKRKPTGSPPEEVSR